MPVIKLKSRSPAQCGCASLRLTAMLTPSKSPGKPKAYGAKMLRSGRVKLNDLSIGSDSGWRDLDPDRVAELVNMIKDGLGQTLD